MLWGLVSEALLKSWYVMTPLATPPLAHRTSCSVTENSHIGQAQFAVGKSILSVPACLLVLQMFVREEDVLHGFNEAEKGLTLLPFSKVSVTFGTSCQGPSKSPCYLLGNRQQPRNHFSSSLSPLC